MSGTTQTPEHGDPPANRPRDRIRRPAPGSLRDVWPSEARDFTPWLTENMDYLDVLGLGPLRVVEIEAPLPDTWRSLDILAEAADERRIAIENQFGEIDHDHLTRGLAYAVGHGAAALVVIAEAHRPEFVATAEYLNHAAEALGLERGGIGVYLVGLAVERLDDWYIPRLELIAGPNRWLSQAVDGRPGRLRSVEEFLDQLLPERRESMRAIIDDWSSRPGGFVTHNAAFAVALRVPKPAAAGDVAVLTAQVPGSIWINRGYVLAALEPAGVGEAELDDIIRATWPGARSTEKNYYLTVPEPVPAEYRRFADAFWELLRGLEASGAAVP